MLWLGMLGSFKKNSDAGRGTRNATNQALKLERDRINSVPFAIDFDFPRPASRATRPGLSTPTPTIMTNDFMTPLRLDHLRCKSNTRNSAADIF